MVGLWHYPQVSLDPNHALRWQDTLPQENHQIIRSLDSTEPWVYNWDKQMWILDAATAALAEMREEEVDRARQRKRMLENAVDEVGDVLEEPPAKRPKLLELTIIRPYLHFARPRQGADQDS